MIKGLYIEEPKKNTFTNSIARTCNGLGLGKPTIKLEFENNEELVEFQNKLNNMPSEFPHTLTYNKEGYLVPVEEELSGIDEETKAKFFKLIESEPQYINLKNDANNYYNNQIFLKEDSNGNKKRAYKFISPIEEVYCWSDFKHIIHNNSNRQNRTNILPLIKPTIENPNLIVNYEGENYYIKPFITENNEKIIFSFIPTLVSNSNLKTLFTPKRNYLYNKFFDKDGKKKQTAVLRYQKIGILDANSIFNGTEPQGAPFEIVELRLFIIETQNNKKSFKNQNSLNAPGDLYLVRDLRSKRARKEPSELLANKNLKFIPIKGAEIKNFNRDIYNEQKYFSDDIKGFKKIYLTDYGNGRYQTNFVFFVPKSKLKDTDILTGSRTEIYVYVDISKVFNIVKKPNDVQVLIAEFERNEEYNYGNNRNTPQGYITETYYKELKEQAFKELESKILNSNYYTPHQKKLFRELYANPTKYELKDTSFNGLAAPDDLYIITDTRLKSKKDLDEIKSLQKYNIQPFNPEDYASDTGVKLVSLKNIKKDVRRFQNRENTESSESVNRIINAVKKGDFNWAAFDPIVLWKDPQDGNIYVLSGHSRTRAFEILSEQGATVDGKTFNKIPAKFFEGSEQDAIDFALNSNTLSTKETDVERAKYYRRLIGTMPEYKLKELAEQNEGKNANRILAYAHLKPGSYTLNALTRLQDSSTENAELVKTVADWIGRLFIQFPQLTLEHDKEIFNWLLVEGHYGVGSGKINNYQKLLDIIRLAVFRLQGKDGFESDKRLNLSNVGGESDSMKNYNEQLKRLNNEIKDANAELKKKRKEFLQRQSMDKSITRADIDRALKPYNDNIINLQRQILDLSQNKSKYLDADKRQQSLFGRLKDPNIYNTTPLNYNGFMPTYTPLESYDSFFKPSANKDDLSGYGFKDTVKRIKEIVRQNYKDTEKIAQYLKGDSAEQSIFNLWHWLHKNVKYNYDAEGKEQLRTPLRTWHDRKKGVDCDCLSIFAYCVLLNMGLKPQFEMAKFNGKSEFSHIYIYCNDMVLDRVWHVFNERAPFITEVERFSVNTPTFNEQLAGLF